MSRAALALALAAALAGCATPAGELPFTRQRPPPLDTVTHGPPDDLATVVDGAIEIRRLALPPCRYPVPDVALTRLQWIELIARMAERCAAGIRIDWQEARRP